MRAGGAEGFQESAYIHSRAKNTRLMMAQHPTRQRPRQGRTGIAAQGGGGHHRHRLGPGNQSGPGEGDDRKNRQDEGQGVLQPVHGVEIAHSPQREQRQQHDAQAAVEIAAIDRDQQGRQRPALGIQRAGAGPGLQPVAEREDQRGEGQQERHDQRKSLVRRDQQQARSRQSAQRRQGHDLFQEARIEAGQFAAKARRP